MNACLVNDYPKTTGAGKYAFCLFHELRLLDSQIEMHYVGKSSGEKGVMEIDFGFRLPFLDRSIKSVYFLPKKVPSGHALYHVTNQFLAGIAEHRKPCVVTCLDIIPLSEKKDFPFPLGKLLGKAIDSMKKADHILAISEHTKRELVEKLGIEKSRVTVTYLGFDKNVFRKKSKSLARSKLGFRGDQKIVLNVGSEEPRKGIETALMAFRETLDEFPEAMLVRVGEKSQNSEQLIRELGIEKKVSYFHGITDEMLSLLYNSADALLFCSRNEGFGLPLLEASACGLPSVCHKNSSIPEVVGKNAFYTVENSQDAFAAQLSRLFSSQKLAQKVSIGALKNAQQFSWEKCAKETLKVYRKI